MLNIYRVDSPLFLTFEIPKGHKPDENVHDSIQDSQIYVVIVLLPPFRAICPGTFFFKFKWQDAFASQRSGTAALSDNL